MWCNNNNKTGEDNNVKAERDSYDDHDWCNCESNISHSQYNKDHIDNDNVMIYWYQYMDIS